MTGNSMFVSRRLGRRSPMPELRLSVVIPTIGRATLHGAVNSAREADEVIVVLDKAGDPGVLPGGIEGANVLIASVVGGDHGYTARTRGMQLATGSHIAFMDDDDEFSSGAIPLMRSVACERPVIFRMNHPDFGVIWRDRELRLGNVSTQMFLVPNDPARLGKWVAHRPGVEQPGGDFTFIQGCCEPMGDPVWRKEIVAEIRPSESRLRGGPASGGLAGRGRLVRDRCLEVLQRGVRSPGFWR